MSYGKDDRCGSPQYKGVVDALKDITSFKLNIKSYFLKAKSLTKDKLKEKQNIAVKIFKNFKPDISITIDDTAFQTLAKFYTSAKGHGYLVFTGINIPPEEYNKKLKFIKGRYPIARITGVFEKLYIKEQLDFFRLIIGRPIRKVAVIYSNDAIGKIVMKQIVNELKGTRYEKKIYIYLVETLNDLRMVCKRINKNRAIDAYIPACLSLLSDGRRIPIQKFSSLLLRYIHKPDLTLNSSFCDLGFFGGVSVDFYYMGKRAGEMVKMLLDNYPIGRIRVEDAPKKVVVINLRRAKEIKLRIPPSVMALVDRVIQ